MPRTKPAGQPLHEALTAILRLLKRQRIPHMVMGGVALSAWGRIRATQDVDVAVMIDRKQEPEIIVALQKNHFLSSSPRTILGHRWLAYRYLKQTRGLPVQVDLFFAVGPYQKQAIQRAVRVSLGREGIPIIAPEDLILHKLLADRPIDRLDVKAILEEQRGRLDWSYLRRWAKRLGLSSRVELIPIRPMKRMRGFLKGIRTDVPRDPDRV